MKPLELKNTVNISVIGTGRIAWQLENDRLRYKPCTHIGALKTLAADNIPLYFKSFCDINEDKAAAAAAFAGNKKAAVTADYKDIIKDRVDLLVIASSTESHFDILRAALKADIPSIVVEKPVTANATEAAKLRRLSRNSGSHIWLNYERRYHHKYRKIRKWIQNEKYGKALAYRGFFGATNASFYPDGKFEGVLLHDTTHLLDLVFFLFGEATYTDVAPLKKRGERTLHHLHLHHLTGIPGEITTMVNSPFFQFELEILFEKGRLRTGNGFITFEPKIQSRHYEGFYSLDEAEQVKIKKMKLKRNPFIKLYQNVLQGSADPALIDQACRNVEILLNG